MIIFYLFQILTPILDFCFKEYVVSFFPSSALCNVFLSFLCFCLNSFIGKMLPYSVHNVTRLGDFLNLLATHFLTKVAFWKCLGYWEKTLVLSKDWRWYIWGNFWKHLATFIPTSGHTARAAPVVLSWS